jgi:hypothetical protein
MEAPLTRVLIERERLRARIDRQRRDVDRYVAGLAGPAAIIDRVRSCGRFVGRHPAALLGVVAAGFALRARSAAGLLARGLGLWRLARRAQVWLRYVGY